MSQERICTLYCRLGLLILVAGLVACSESTTPKEPEGGKADGLALPEASRKYIEIEAVGKGLGALGNVHPGRLAFRPQAMAAIGTPMAARILTVEARPGEVVKAGAPLLTLQSADVAEARASLVQAEAKAASAEDLLRRQNAMIQKGVGLEYEHLEAVNAAREARAELERARRTVEIIGGGEGDRFVIRSPASGVVLTIRGNVGQVVSPGGDALGEVGDPSRIWVVADIPESEFEGIAAGRTAEVYVPGADSRFEATVNGVGKVVNSDTRRLPIYLLLKGDAGNLTAGMLAEVSLSNTDDTTLSLPASAVLIKDGARRVVYVQREDGRFEQRQVRTGVSQGGRVMILEGLRPGEKVVVRGALFLDSSAEQLL